MGLDALEYTLVEQFRLTNLKQLEYGKVDISSFKKILTPMIWTSFITGLSPKEHGVTAFYKWDEKWARWLRNFSASIGLGRIKEKGRILEKFGLAHRRIHEDKDLKERGIKTIFDYAEHPIAFSVPSYNEEPSASAFHKTDLLKGYYDGKVTGEEVKKRVWSSFERRKRNLTETLDRDKKWDLLMFYEHGATDLLGHIFRGNLTEMWEIYVQMDLFLKEVKEKIGDETFTLVVSDHGMKPVGRYGVHSSYAFYSSNIPLNLNFPKITDFKDIILEKLRE